MPFALFVDARERCNVGGVASGMSGKPNTTVVSLGAVKRSEHLPSSKFGLVTTIFP